MVNESNKVSSFDASLNDRDISGYQISEKKKKSKK